MGRIGRLLIRRVPIGFRVPLVWRSGCSGWAGRGSRRTTGSWSVVGSPLLLGSLGRVLTAVLTCAALPSTGIHLRSLLVRRIRLLILFKVGMPPRLIRLIGPVVVRLWRLLRGRRISLGLLRRRRLLSGCTAHRWLTGSTRRTSRRCLRRAGTARWRLLTVRSLLRRRRIRTAGVASVRIASRRRCGTRCRGR